MSRMTDEVSYCENCDTYYVSSCRCEDSRPAACSLPPYDEWKKLPPDEAARLLAKARGWDAETESCIAATLEWFKSKDDSAENAKDMPSAGGDTTTTQITK